MVKGDLPYKMHSSRKPDWLAPELVAEHTRHVGEVTVAWARFHDALFAIFSSLLGRDHQLAHGIWHCIRNDSAQRDMLLAAAETKLTKHKRILSQIRWLAQCAQALTTYRNDLAHTSFYFDIDLDTNGPYLRPNVSGRKASVGRLEKENDPELWAKVAGDLRALQRYASAIAIRIMGRDRPISGSWPRRPKLQSLLATKRYGKPRLRPHTPRVPQPQRRSWAEAEAARMNKRNK